MLIYVVLLYPVLFPVFLQSVYSSILHKRAIERNIVRPPTKACLDFCIYTNCNLGECILDPNTCYARCVCPENVTGRWCDRRVENTDDETSTLMSSRQQNRIHFDSRTPRLSKESEDKTLTISRSTIKNSNVIIKSNENSTLPHNFESRESRFKECKIVCPLGKCVETNSEYICMNFSSQCADDFVCFHGVCSNSSSGQNENASKCLCEYGYSGTLCDKECKRDCGNHGVCMIENELENSTKCSCDIGYSGSFCTINNNTIDTAEYMKSNNESLPDNFKSRSKQWFDCQRNCTVDGSCVDFNNTYICSYSLRTCAPGFNCKHGRCLTTTTDNARSFKCLCEYGYIGTFCNTTCSKDCGLNGRCKITDKKNHTTQCVCDSEYSGPFCTLKVTHQKDGGVLLNQWYVIGACIGIAAFLLTLIIMLPYCLWKKRRVFVMKIIHYFQNYEDDDGKTYDAFISYKSTKSDQEFVLKKLYPKLELEMGYKLCMHFRDFTPGDVIANNIIKAIEDSRRSIMIISRNYIESEWCRLEYQKAQHEMLKLKHRIIPIILDDISKVKHDKNLKAILNSVTYIEWPGESDSKKLEKFWKQLKLSMPKRQLCSSSEPGMSVISSSEKSFIGSSYTASCSSGFSCHSAGQPNNSSEYEDNSNSNRIKTLIRNPFRLNITSDNFKKLSRAYSSDSGISSPITASPSSATPLIHKDHNPLIPRKQVDIRHNNSKGLILQNKMQLSGPHRQNGNKIVQVEKSVTKESINPVVSNIGNYNIVVEEPTTKIRRCNSSICRTCILNAEISNEFIKESSKVKSRNNADCTTCVFHSDISNQNENELWQPNIIQDKIINTSKILNTVDRTNTI